MEDFINLFSTTGFPIALSVFLLVRFESKISELNDTINRLTIIIERSFKDE